MIYKNRDSTPSKFSKSFLAYESHDITVTSQPQIQPTLALRTPNITDTPIIRTAAKSPAKTNYRRLTEINCRYSELVSSLARVRNSESLLQSNFCNLFFAGDLAAVRIIGEIIRRELAVHFTVSIYFLNNFLSFCIEFITVFRQLRSSGIYFICSQLR